MFSLIKVLAVSPLASRGFAPRGDQKKMLAKFVKGPRKSSAKKKKDQGNLRQTKKIGGIFCFLGGWLGGVPPPKKIA